MNPIRHHFDSVHASGISRHQSECQKAFLDTSVHPARSRLVNTCCLTSRCDGAGYRGIFPGRKSLGSLSFPSVEPCSAERPNAGGGTGYSGTRGRPNRKRGCNGKSVCRARVTPSKESGRYCWQGFKLFSMPKAKRNDRRALAEGKCTSALEVLCLALSLPLSFSPSSTGTVPGTVQDQYRYRIRSRSDT